MDLKLAMQRDCPRPPRPRLDFATVRTRPYAAVALVALSVMAVGAVAKHDSSWSEVFVGAGTVLRQGRDYYRVIPPYTYPPFSALVMLPFSYLPDRLARGIWYVICAASALYLIGTAWKLSGGPPLQRGDRPAPLKEHVAFLLGNLFALQFVLGGLAHLQTDLLIGGLLMAGCAALHRGKSRTAAVWIGAAAAFKATPLLFAPYLALRRKWAAAGLVFAVAVGLNLLPDLVHRVPTGGLWLTRWVRLYLEPMTEHDYKPGDWKNQLNNNQSLAGAARRWLGTTMSFGADKAVDRPDGADPRVQLIAYLSACAALTLPAAWVMLRRKRNTPDPGTPLDATDGLPDPVMIECGLVMLLMLLLSPNTSSPHYCIAFLAAFCAARRSVLVPETGMRILAGLALTASVLSIHVRLPFTRGLEQMILWLGLMTFAAIFLLAHGVLSLWRSYRRIEIRELEVPPAQQAGVLA